MTNRNRKAKQAEFIRRIQEFCSELEKDGFFLEENGCKTFMVASTDKEIQTMCVGDGPSLAGMIAQFMAEDENQARVIDVAYNSFCQWLENKAESPEISVEQFCSQYMAIRKDDCFS